MPRHKTVIGRVEQDTFFSQLTITAVLELGVDQSTGTVPNPAQARDSLHLGRFDLSMNVPQHQTRLTVSHQAADFHPVNAALVNLEATRFGPYSCGQGRSLGYLSAGGTSRGLHFRYPAVIRVLLRHLFRKERDALQQHGLQISLEGCRGHHLMAVALPRDLSDIKLRPFGVPGVDLTKADLECRVTQDFRHLGCGQPVPLGSLTGLQLAQKEHIGLCVGRSQFAEGSRRQADRTEQLSLRGQIRPVRLRAGIHRAAAGDETQQTSRPDQVQTTTQKIVVNAEAGVRLATRIQGWVVTKRHIANGQIEPVLG